MDRRSQFINLAGRALGLALLLTLAWCGLNLPALASWVEVNAASSPVATPTPLPVVPPDPDPAAEMVETPPPAGDELLRQAGAAAFAAAFPGLPFEVGLTRTVGEWAFINFRASPAEDQGSWDVYLGLGRWDGAAWGVAVEGSPDFAAWLAECPEELIPAEARPYLLPGQVEAAGAPGLWLPFPVGQTWKYIAGPNGGPRREAVDFGPFTFEEPGTPSPAPTFPLTGRERDVTAAATGVVVDHDDDLVILRHGDYPAWETGYSSLAPESNLAQPGQVVFQGQRLGAASPVGDPAKGHHVHFWVRLNGVDQVSDAQVLSEWQIYLDNSFLTGPNAGRLIYRTGLERIDCRTVARFDLALDRCSVKHFPVTPSPLPAAIVSLSPVTLTLPVGDITTTLVSLQTSTGVSRAYLRLSYSPASAVELIDAFPDQVGVQVAPGNVFNSFPQVIFLNEVRPAPGNSGLIEFLAERQAPAPAFTGFNHLIEISWQRLAPGPVTLTLEAVELADPNGRPVPAVISSTGVMQIQAGALLHGQIELQGRPDAGGVQVSAGGRQVKTDPAGRFEIGGPAAYSLAAAAPGYLSARAEGQAADDAAIDLGQVTLPGGDVTGDNRVDIFDLAALGSRYGAAAVIDLTGDGRVDIYDLAVAAANYGRQGPVEW